MKLYLSKLPKREEINANYLSNLYNNNEIKNGLSYKGFMIKNGMVINTNNPKNAYMAQRLERQFQFNFVVKTFNSLINNKKRKTGNSQDIKGRFSHLFLPSIKNSSSSKNINKNNCINNEELLSNLPSNNKESPQLNNLASNNYSENNNNKTLNELSEKFSKSKNLDKSNSTIVSQSIVNNRVNSKMINQNNETESEKNRSIFRNLSHGSIFAAYKKQYLSSIREYKLKNKIAENNFKEQLEKIRKEKVPKSKNEEYFKEYEIKFNPYSLTAKLRNEFQFFRNDVPLKSKTVDLINQRRKKNYEDKKNSNYYDIINNEMKPSKRIIRNMLRRDKKMEQYEESLLDLKE